ncbi:hypothetical protein quinque_015782 [Culex quinquefasciatus]
MYSPSDNVVELTDGNFERLVVKSDEVWVVEFYAPWCGHCQQLAPEYKKAASALKGVVKVGGVNCDEQKSVCGQYGVRGFPTIKIFGGNKRSPVDYNGQRAAKEIAESALAEVKKKVKNILGGGGSGGGSDGGSSDSKDVVELTDANFDKLVLNSEDIWLVEFYAPWCGHCKNLAPHWAKAASELKGKVKLGALDSTVHTIKAQQFGIQGYPTIKFFPEVRSDRDTAPGLRRWSHLVGHCQLGAGEFLATLAKMGEKYKKKLWGWLWTEGGAQPEIEATLDIGGFGYPAMAVVNVKKMKYSLLRGSFSEEGINEFLRDLSYGRGHTAPIKGAELPKIHTIEAWDGKDGQLPEEEDIDLSDVDLDEKDELST